MKNLFVYLFIGLVLLSFTACSDTVFLGIDDKTATTTRAWLDPDPTPITPGDSILPPVRPNPILTEYENGMKQANMEVTDNFKRYAKNNKHKYEYTYLNTNWDPPVKEKRYDVSNLYVEFCDREPWALDRRSFVSTFDEDNAGDYMKGYYSILRTTVCFYQLPLTNIPWEDIIK